MTRPLPYVDLTLDLVPRQWLVSERIPARNVTLISGEGGGGKTILLMQLSGAVVLGSEWIGTRPQQGPALYVNCEEDDDEIRRRMEAVANYLVSTRQTMHERGLRFLSFAGHDATLAQPNRNGIMQPTALFARIEREALQLRPKLIVIDPVADVFAGKEIDRTQARQFITMLRGLAMRADGAVIISSHPSLTGIASDSGLSGSTAWHNSVRARMYFKAAPGKDGSLRVLEFRKNNYGPISETILLRWREGVYIAESGSLDPQSAEQVLKRLASEQEVDELFLTLLRRHTGVGRNVTDKPGISYAPAIFATDPEAKQADIGKKAFAESMARLFAAKRIRVIPFGPASKLRSKIIEEPMGTVIPFPGLTSNALPTPGVVFQRPSNELPISPKTPPNDIPTEGSGVCAPSPPYPPCKRGPPAERGSAQLAAPSDARKKKKGEERTQWGVTFTIIGDAPPGSTCLYCKQGGTDDEGEGVMRISPGGHLHPACAPAWLNNQDRSR